MKLPLNESASAVSGVLRWEAESKGRNEMDRKILSLRMERQCFLKKADEDEYLRLYRDTQPGQNVYWNGFGQPPTLSFRAAFDDIAYNRGRQLKRELIKGRFSGGNLGWIVPEDMELFLALYRKPLGKAKEIQLRLLELIEREGPLTIRQMKEATGLLVKEITPVLHRLQEAFLVYEDQYDGEWDRGWYPFGEMFQSVNPEHFSRLEALKIVLQRFAYRLVWFNTAMARSFYKIPEREIRQAIGELSAEGVLTALGSGYVLRSDAALLGSYQPKTMHFVYAVHRSDFLFKTQEHDLLEMARKLTEGLPYDHEPLQFLLIDGEFRGAAVGHFRNGPYDLLDVVCDLPDAQSRREEILEAVSAVNFGRKPQRFMGEPVE